MIRQQWVNIDDEGALHALLRRLADSVPIETIDTLWLLPTRRATGVESTVVVISAFDAHNPDRRRVGAVRWLVTRDRKGAATVSEQMHEYASAPADALPRVVEGVMRRLGDDAAQPPRAESIDGDTDRWNALLRQLGEPPGAATTESSAPPETVGSSDSAPPYASAESGAAADGAPVGQTAADPRPDARDRTGSARARSTEDEVDAETASVATPTDPAREFRQTGNHPPFHPT